MFVIASTGRFSEFACNSVTQNKRQAGRNTAQQLHLFIALFQCPIHDYHLCKVLKISGRYIHLIEITLSF